LLLRLSQPVSVENSPPAPPTIPFTISLN